MKYSRIVAEFYSRIWAIREETLMAMQGLIRQQASGVKWTPEEVRERIAAANAASGYLGHESLEARFLATELDENPTASTPLLAASGKRNKAQPGSVAVIPMTGIISHRMSMMDEISGGGGGSTQALTAAFRQALEDGNCKAIVFDVDSPGGSVEGVMELAQEIYEARKTKPITAVCNAMACSAAYWLASAASDLVVTPSGQCGSIGVYMLTQDVSKALEQEGVKINLIKYGKYKAEGHPSQPLSDEAQAYLQSQVDSMGAMFIKAVAQHRGVSQAAAKENFGQGRSLLAADAVKAGLADRTGTLDDVLAKYGVKRGASGSGARAEATPTTEALSHGERCCECGAPASHGAVDFQELPRENGFACWKPIVAHHGCEKHWQRSKRVRLNGEVEYGDFAAKKPVDDPDDPEPENNENACKSCKACSGATMCGCTKADDSSDGMMGCACACDACKACAGKSVNNASAEAAGNVLASIAQRRRRFSLL